MPGPTVDGGPARPRVAVLVASTAGDDPGQVEAPFSSRWLGEHYELRPIGLPAGTTATLGGRIAFGAQVARALLKARPRLVHLRCDATASPETHGTCLDVASLLGLPIVVEVADERWLGALDQLPPAALARMRRRFARADVCVARDDAAAEILQRRLGVTAEIVATDAR